ncbi:MAG TPA: hypothetical protein VNA28_10940 [Solirubrobacteraceae bacterium]|nr:hypothetical protein [Solirubrobacteraceae bacterium]
MHKTISRSTALAAVLALGAISTPALAVGPPTSTPNSTSNPGTAFVPAGTPNGTTNPGTSHMPAGTPNDTTNPSTSRPGPNASAKAKGRAYGKYCADQSKKHVKGERGTPFSKCVTAMAKLASKQTRSPRNACKTESKQHVEGEKGTAFSRCVKAAARLLKDQAAT